MKFSPEKTKQNNKFSIWSAYDKKILRLKELKEKIHTCKTIVLKIMNKYFKEKKMLPGVQDVNTDV